jgi:hypothetical protein
MESEELDEELSEECGCVWMCVWMKRTRGEEGGGRGRYLSPSSQRGLIFRQRLISGFPRLDYSQNGLCTPGTRGKADLSVVWGES